MVQNNFPNKILPRNMLIFKNIEIFIGINFK